MRIYRLYTAFEVETFEFKTGDSVCWQYPASEKSTVAQPGQPVERHGKIDKILPTGNLLVVTVDQQYRQYRPEKIMMDNNHPAIIVRE